ncbi:energy-coupling factor transporter ATPase [Limosilactobacillus mucosae]|uniref:energy-coupling factor transporter ATPase n=2 Tax=Bacillota TaxID=1239 RepID=UPI0023B1B2B1|nr:energy-coupling factor transporter ATPase [Limosilactobacillus mucosae]MDE8678030.1 energy-coupling factor transporter ATPase [Limosilactobacillus mucosae]
MIDIQHLSFKYPDRTQAALNDVTLQLPMKKWTAVIGHNGSGKSTLARLIDGLLIPSSGTIKIDELLVDEKNLQQLRQQIGLVFQNPDNQFVGTTVADDVAFGLENHQIPHDQMQARIDESLKAVGMQDFADSEPAMLSGGQKQRVALAGILAIGPRVIILDEATSMLDPKGRHDLLKLLKKLIAERDMTVISITHDPVELSLSDYTVVLDHGKVAMQGETATLLQDPAKLADLHLALPFAQRLQLLLKKRGINAPAQYLDSERMVEWLCQQLNS